MSILSTSRFQWQFLLYASAGIALLLVGFAVGGKFAPLSVLLAIVASLLVITRASFVQVGLVSATGAALTAPWNAVIISHVRPSDALLVVALASFLAAGIDRRIFALPLWLWQLAFVIVLLAILHQLVPTSSTYLDGRTVVNAIGIPAPEAFTNMGIAGRWLISLLAVPMMLLMAVYRRPDSGRWIAGAYAIGAAASGFVAFTDRLGITSISSLFVVPGLADRQVGLTLQPNHLAAGSTLAVPICVWLIVQRRNRTAAIGAVCLIGALVGTYQSGSRGGTVATILGLMLSVVLMRRLRQNLLLIVLGTIALVLAFIVALPPLVHHFANSTRLGPNANGVAGSDSIRSLLATQAHHDIGHSPIFGIGLQVTLDAHDIYLQMLAAGGVVLLTSMIVFALGAFRMGLRLGKRDQLGFALLISMVTWFTFGAVENGLIDRYLYFPMGLIVALASVSGAWRDALSSSREGESLDEPAVASW